MAHAYDEYDSASKRKEIWTHATTWENLVDTMPREKSQSHSHKHRVIPVIRGPRGVRCTEAEARKVG